MKPRKKGKRMPIIKITVFKTDYDEALACEYGCPEAQRACHRFHEGEVIYCDKHYQPQDFCDGAWKAMEHHVYAIYHGETAPLGGRGWMKMPQTACITCNNGLSPVTFLVEGIEEDEEILKNIQQSW